jgi:ATP-dependent RNA helicase MSS116, mitochondrial
VESIASVLTTLHTVLACEQLDEPALKAVVFTHTARNAGILYQLFSIQGVSPGNLPKHQMHSRMSQTARNKTVDAFKQADRGLLFASDVVGRGMDFPDIGLVVQIGIPMNSEQYVHRVGRTGRAGKIGRAVIILAPEEMVFVRKNPQFPIKNTGL